MSLIEEELDKDGNPKIEIIDAEGIVRKFGFHPERLESYREEVKNILNELPDKFHEDKVVVGHF